MPAAEYLQDQAPLTTSATTKEPSSPASPTDETAGFFSLPRELRDTIYDLLYFEHEHKPHGLDKTEIMEGSESGYTVYTHASVPQAHC
jgi:hypothetical protein